MELEPFDRDLGLRLQNRPAGAPWWAVQLTGAALESTSGTTRVEPEGDLFPLLQTSLGETVIGYWQPPDRSLRWYFLPDRVDWSSITAWLVSQALPSLAPTVLRRVRSPHLVTPDLFTADETSTRRALQELDEQYVAAKARLEADLAKATEVAEPVRYNLLYDTGLAPVDAVARVLCDAGFTVVDLDTELGQTQSADLLVRWRGHSRLIEVKSAAGRPSDNAAKLGTGP